MGVPLIGRGVIQIWCVLNSKEEEPPPTEPKKRGRKRLVRTESCNDLGNGEVASVNKFVLTPIVENSVL